MINSVELYNAVTGAKIDIGKSNRKYVLDSIDWDSPSVELSTFHIPKQIGKSLSGVTVGTRNPSITGYVVADTLSMNNLGKTWEEYYAMQEQEIRENKRALNKLISVYQDIIIKADGYNLLARPTQSPKYSIEETENNEVLCFFTLEFESLLPLFYGDTKQGLLSSVRNEFHFPLIIPEDEGIIFGEIRNETTKYITNDGDVDVGCTIIIKALGGKVVNPTIHNISTGEHIGFEGVTIEDGEYLIITTEKGEENAILYTLGARMTDNNVVSYLTLDSIFLQLPRGRKLYSYVVDEGYGYIDVTIEFNEKYFNIEGM